MAIGAPMFIKIVIRTSKYFLTNYISNILTKFNKIIPESGEFLFIPEIRDIL
jgi:hypothetical protein